ncbi:MAG TPA: hypothetical protein VN962_11420 [Polyangia bacterium]|nr:hypothetical protein [Polyangia bacterium]
MIARALCQALLLFTISSAVPSLERSAIGGVHAVQGRRHHRRRHHEKRRRERHHDERPREGTGEL